jgi:hypothetical protein
VFNDILSPKYPFQFAICWTKTMNPITSNTDFVGVLLTLVCLRTRQRYHVKSTCNLNHLVVLISSWSERHFRNAVAKKVVHESTTNDTGSFFLFSTRIVRSNPRFTTYAARNNSIAPGSYTLTATVNGIQQPSLNLFIDNKVPCRKCNILGSFRIDA